MATWRRHLSFWLTAAALLGACTDGRRPEQQPVRTRQVASNTHSTMRQIAQVRFQGADTETLTMQTKFGSLFLTGRPFGFSRWDISADPENPTLTFAASDQIDTFAPNGRWVVDWYASGALGILGRYAFLSGTAGLSVIDISETNHPREVLRRPPVSPQDEGVTRDLAYVYKAIVPHPTQPILYGFREQDFVYTLQLGNGLQLVRKEAYAANTTVCCVKAATVFQNHVFVAFGARLVWFKLNSNGTLGPPGVFDELQASYVASSDNYLYVYHSPTYGQAQGVKNPRGFYVFDRNGDNVDYIATNVIPRQFQVSPNDSHFFINVDNTSIEVHRIEWAGGY